MQLTHKENYASAGGKVGADLVGNPDLAMRPDIAARILVLGILEGWFTTKKADDYIDGIDESDDEDLREFIAARRIVNGSDRAEKIGKYALQFEVAIKASGGPKAPATEIAPQQKQPNAKAQPAALFGIIMAILAATFTAIFGGKRG